MLLRHLLRSAVGVLIIVLVLAACGGEDNAAPTTPPSTPTRVVQPTAAPSPTTVGPTATPAAQPVQRAQWRQLSASGSAPPGRRNHTLVLDSQRGVLLFGGRAGSQEFNDLWRYDIPSSLWRQLQPQGGPPPSRWGHVAVFDAATNRMLIFTGQSSRGFFQDAWAYDVTNNRWDELRAQGGPPSKRYGSSGAYDPRLKVAYVTHGFTDQGRFDDTWALDGGAGRWQDVSPAQGAVRPIERCLHDGAFDAVNGVMLLYGGQTTGNPFLGDLWAYDPGARTWREIKITGPAARNFTSLVVDGTGKRGILFGGAAASGRLGDLWVLDLSRYGWSQLQVPGSGPSAREGHDAVWDEAGKQMIIFGGRDSSEKNDLWALSFGA